MAWAGGVYPRIELRDSLGLLLRTWTFKGADNLVGWQFHFPPLRFKRFGPTNDPARLFSDRFDGCYLAGELKCEGQDNALLVDFLMALKQHRGRIYLYPAPGVLYWPNSSREYWIVNADLDGLDATFHGDPAGRVRTAYGHDVTINFTGIERVYEPPMSADVSSNLFGEATDITAGANVARLVA